MTKHSNQKTVTITSMHGKTNKLSRAYDRLTKIFNDLKAVAPQLTQKECWQHLFMKVMEIFAIKESGSPPPEVPALA